MARYAGQKRRATTSKTYAMDSDYNKVLQDAKRLHRYDGGFYIVMVYGVYSSVSIRDYQTYKYNGNIEHWKFENRRWKKIENIGELE